VTGTAELQTKDADAKLAVLIERSVKTDAALAQIAESIQAMQGDISKAAVASSTSAQDRSDMRRTMDDLKRTIVGYMGHTHPMVDEIKKRQDSVIEKMAGMDSGIFHLRDAVTTLTDTSKDHETRLRDNDKKMNAALVAVIVAVILPLVLFALQRLFP
jgi:uncharacterized coiled-coil DUF342 family protein